MKTEFKLRPCGEVKNIHQKNYSKIYLNLLNFTRVVDVELVIEIYCTGWD